VALAAVVNTISQDAKGYFAAGGMGILRQHGHCGRHVVQGA
jgi:hypothetical protein